MSGYMNCLGMWALCPGMTDSPPVMPIRAGLAVYSLNELRLFFVWGAVMIKAAVIQLKMDDDKNRAQRFLQVEKYLEEIRAWEEKPQLILLPEIWGSGFFNFDRYIKESEPLQGETFSRLAPWAAEIGCYLLAGSIVEADEGRYYNTSLLIGPGGGLAAHYRKMHLFGYQSGERAILTAGEEVVTVETPFGVWGISTCYDLRFPELYRSMVDAGAELFLVVAAWPAARLEHWVLFNRIRALENLCFLISCNCAGSLKGTGLGGNSMVVDPWGEVIARAGENEEVMASRLDPERAAGIREQFPALDDRTLK